MKKIFLVTALLFVSQVGLTQSSSGLNFETGLTWQQIILKAKAENKYILLDCFATWCGPCKAMDQEIYPDPLVGNALNSKFICVKVQMDTSSGDNDYVRSWRKDAMAIEKTDLVNAFPTFLYFNPSGEEVHRAMGYKSVQDFIREAADAQDTAKAYNLLRKRFLANKMPYDQMAYLARLAKDNDQRAVADSVAWTYIDQYLLKLNHQVLFTPDNIAFIGEFLQYTHQTSGTAAFKLFYNNYQTLTSLFQVKQFARNVVDYVITAEELEPAAEKARKNNLELDWGYLYKQVKTKYNQSFADRVIVNYQLAWFEAKAKKDWPKLVVLNAKKIDLEGLDTAGFIGKYQSSGILWNVIFLHCNEKLILNKAIGWSKKLLNATGTTNADLTAGLTDTYANLLYKTGHKAQAMKWEHKAIELEEMEAKRTNRAPDQDIAENLKKMKENKPTWLTSN